MKKAQGLCCCAHFRGLICKMLEAIYEPPAQSRRREWHMGLTIF